VGLSNLARDCINIIKPGISKSNRDEVEPILLRPKIKKAGPNWARFWADIVKSGCKKSSTSAANSDWKWLLIKTESPSSTRSKTGMVKPRQVPLQIKKARSALAKLRRNDEKSELAGDLTDIMNPR